MLEFEAHITCDAKDAEALEVIVRRLPEWKFSKIDGDPVLGEKVFCYLSAHEQYYTSIFDRVTIMCTTLVCHDIKPLRAKIERIDYDKRFTEKDYEVFRAFATVMGVHV